MTTKKFALLLVAFAVLVPVLTSRAQGNPEGWSGELVWPREYSNEAGAKLTMYQPQVTEWKGTKRIEARVAIAFSAPGEEASSLGAFEIEGDTEVDLETRLVKLSAVEIVKHRFPSLDEQRSQKLLAKLGELMPKDEVVVALDRILASLERAIETKDMTLYRSVRPDLSADEASRVRAGFEAVQSQQVDLRILLIDVQGDQAVVRLSRRDTIQTSSGEQTLESNQTMTLTRMPGGWVITQMGG